MRLVKCLKCSKEFPTYTNKFCSQKCYFESDIRKHNTPEHIKKSTKGLKKYYNSEKGREEKKIRNKKISDSHKLYYTQEEIKLLKQYLEAGYVRDLRILNSKITTRVSYKALLNTLEIHMDLRVLKLKNKGEIPTIVQKMSLKEWEEFKINFTKYNVTEFCEKFNFSQKAHLRIRKLLNVYPNKYWRLKETLPEKRIEDLLTKYKITFEKQKRIGKYIADFQLNNIIIEVQGDYWHGNTRFYSEKA